MQSFVPVVKLYPSASFSTFTHPTFLKSSWKRGGERYAAFYYFKNDCSYYSKNTLMYMLYSES